MKNKFPIIKLSEREACMLNILFDNKVHYYQEFLEEYDIDTLFQTTSKLKRKGINIRGIKGLGYVLRSEWKGEVI